MTTSFPRRVAVHDLRPSEREAIEGFLDRLTHRYPAADDLEFLADARRLGFSLLPRNLVDFIARFGRTEFAPAVVVTGLTVDDDRIGPTPPHWRAQADPRTTVREEMFLVLVGSLLGDVFGWGTLQDGHLVHNVVPIRHEEEEQSGHGSTVTLAWHTEDGFHPYRCDYLGLMALRNDQRVPTTFASVETLELTAEQRRTLAEPRFVICPDNEHLRQPAVWRGLAPPDPVAVLFGDHHQPYLRIDPFFMSARLGDREAEDALAAVVDQLDRALQDVHLDPGTVCFIDNYRSVHGRQAFLPKYDGRDRWLKKIGVTRDLRKSRANRRQAEARVLLPILAAPDSDDPVCASSPRCEEGVHE